MKVVLHIIVTLVVLTITAIVTAGYYQTCQNLYFEVRNTVRSRVDVEKWGTGKNLRNNEIIDVFSNDRSINRYTNPNTDSWGNNANEYGITCRNILTDPEVHSQLKMNHAANPYYKQYYGFWYRHDVADVGDIRYYTYRNNMIIEMSMAGAWISFVLWTVMLVLMVKERHHIKAHLTDESMFGSEFGGASRRSASRLSNQSFDRSSRASAGQRSRSGSRPPQQFDQMSNQGSIPGSQRSGGGGRRANGHQQQVPYLEHQPIQKPLVQNSLLDYFSTNPNMTDEVDIDTALQEDLALPETGPLDTSFGSGGLPDNLVNADEHGGPIALGDEVSQAYSSNNDVFDLDDQGYFANNFNDEGPIFSNNPLPHPNPNRQQGRRGGGRPSSAGRGQVGQRSPSHSMTRGHPHQQHHYPQTDQQRSHSQVDQQRSYSQASHNYISKSPNSSFRKGGPRIPTINTVSFGKEGPHGQVQQQHHQPPQQHQLPQQQHQQQHRSYRTSLGNQSMI